MLCYGRAEVAGLHAGSNPFHATGSKLTDSGPLPVVRASPLMVATGGNYAEVFQNDDELSDSKFLRYALGA